MAKTKSKKKVGKKAPAAKKAPHGGKKKPADKAPQKEATTPGQAAKKKPKVSQEELAALRKPVTEAKAKLEAARKEAQAIEAKAQALVTRAKDAYREAVTPYRDACRKAGVECEFEGGRSANVAAKVSFLVEKIDKGLRVTIKGQPKTAEVIPFAVLKESVNKAAYAYTDKHIGPREKIGNKGGGLSNRLRKALTKK